VLKSVRIADGDRDLPDANRARVAQAGPRGLRAVDSQDRKIGIRIVADKICTVRPAVDEGRRDALRLGDNVAVGEDEAVGREDETRPAAGPTASTA